MENAARKLLAAKSLKYEGAVALISNGSTMLLSTNLTTCAMQITDLQMVHKQLNNSYIPQYIVVVNIEMSKCGVEGKCSQKHNTHYLRIKCVLQAHHENNAYCVRIG